MVTERVWAKVGRTLGAILIIGIVALVVFNAVRLHQAGGATAVLERVAVREGLR